MNEEFKDYLVEYSHNGSIWTLKMRAASFDDAQQRCRQIYYARVLGTVEAEIPASAGWLSRIICWAANRLRA